MKARRRTRYFRDTLLAFYWLAQVGVLFYAVENWRGARRLAEVRNRLEQHGANLDWRSFAPAEMADEQNVAMHPLLRPLSEYEQSLVPLSNGGRTITIRWLDPNGLRRLAEVQLPTGWKEGKKHKFFEPNKLHPVADLISWQTCFRHDTNFPSPPQPGAPADDVLLALTKFEPELRQLHEALARPGCRFPLRYDDRPDDVPLRHLATLRGFASVLRLRAAAHSAAQDGEAALADTHDILKLADCLKDEPLLCSFKTRAAIFRIGCFAIGDGLARQAWSDAQIHLLQTLMAKQELLRGLELALKGDAASALQSLAAIRADGGLIDCRGFESLRWVPRGWFGQNEATFAEHIYLRALPTFNASIRRVNPTAANADADGLKSLRLTPYSVYSHWRLPDTRAAVRCAAYAQTRNDQALLACALERHRIAMGCFPESLDALVPDYMPELPRDVVAGASLRYRVSPNGGFQLWSVGWNERDEEGLVSKSSRGTILIDEGDWVWERRALN